MGRLARDLDWFRLTESNLRRAYESAAAASPNE